MALPGAIHHHGHFSGNADDCPYCKGVVNPSAELPPVEETPIQQDELLTVLATEEVLDVADELSAKRKAFVREFLKDSNGTRAAIRAGYSIKTAGQIAHLLLQDSRVSNALRQAQAQLAERVNITQEKVLSEMAALATSNLDHYIVDDEGQVKLAPGAPANAMAAIQSIERDCVIRYEKGKNGEDGDVIKTYKVKIKLWDKPRPLQLIGKHVQLFAERVEHTGKDGGPIETVTRVERVIVDPSTNGDTASNPS